MPKSILRYCAGSLAVLPVTPSALRILFQAALVWDPQMPSMARRVLRRNEIGVEMVGVVGVVPAVQGPVEPVFHYRNSDDGMFARAQERDLELRARIVLNHPRTYGSACRDLAA